MRGVKGKQAWVMWLQTLSSLLGNMDQKSRKMSSLLHICQAASWTYFSLLNFFNIWFPQTSLCTSSRDSLESYRTMSSVLRHGYLELITSKNSKYLNAHTTSRNTHLLLIFSTFFPKTEYSKYNNHSFKWSCCGTKISEILGIPRKVVLFFGNSSKMLFHSPREMSGNSDQQTSFRQMESTAG